MQNKRQAAMLLGWFGVPSGLFNALVWLFKIGLSQIGPTTADKWQISTFLGLASLALLFSVWRKPWIAAIVSVPNILVTLPVLVLVLVVVNQI